MIFSRRRIVGTAALALPALLVARAARALDAPSGAVVLTVSGALRNPNQGPRAAFDMAMLERLPQRTITTATPWYSAPRSFTGPLLRDVLAAAGAASAGTVRMVALNDYRVDLPYEDAQRHDVIVARLLDGKPMAVRDKGPLFVMYPFDSQPDLRNAVYFSRCVWQLKAIDLL